MTGSRHGFAFLALLLAASAAQAQEAEKSGLKSAMGTEVQGGGAAGPAGPELIRGSVRSQIPDGGSLTRMPDGSEMVRSTDGTIIQIIPKRAAGAISGPAQARVQTETLQNGAVMSRVQNPDGPQSG